MSLTPEQKEARKQGLGGSDAPVAANLSKYKSPATLILEKQGRLPVPELETKAMKRGNRFEEVVAEIYEEETGRKIRRIGTRWHEEHAFMLCHLDRQILSDPRGPGSLQIKTTRLKQDWDEGIPDHVMVQVQHELAVTGYRWASIAVLFDLDDFRYFDVERDNELIEYIITIEKRTWAMVESGEAPPIVWAPDSSDLIKRLYPVDNSRTITLDAPAALDAAHAFLTAKADVAAAEERQEQAALTIKAAMAENAVAELPGFGQVTWKTSKPSTKFDLDRFKTEHPDLVQQYSLTQPGSRRFLVKPGKELVPHGRG